MVGGEHHHQTILGCGVRVGRAVTCCDVLGEPVLGELSRVDLLGNMAVVEILPAQMTGR